MAWDLTAATDYIKLNTLDNEDFLSADSDKQTALLNVSQRTLTAKFTDYTIPDTAVYLFANTLATVFNDTNKLAQQGVASFAVKGISFTFKDGIGSKNGAPVALDSFIPDEVYLEIGAPKGRQVKWTVL